MLACLTGVALQFGVARAFVPHVRRHTGDDRSRAWAFAFAPWLIGSAINIALALVYLKTSPMQLSDGETVAVLAAGMATLVFAPVSFIFAKSVADEPVRPLGLRPVPVAGLIGLAALLAVNLLLTRGWHLG